LLIRLDTKGRVLRPLVIFDSYKWDHPKFDEVLEHEEQRYSSAVSTCFTYDADDCHYSHRYILGGNAQFHDRLIQLCIVIPLDPPKAYRSKPAEGPFKEFEELLGIWGSEGLLSKADYFHKQWCYCKAQWNEYSPPMVLCDNTKCDIGWYHETCVNLEEYSGGMWLCGTCQRIPSEERSLADDSDFDYPTELVDARDDRIQRTKSLPKAWEEHKWPKTEDVLRQFQVTANKMDLTSKLVYTIPRDGEDITGRHQGSWAFRKKNPKRLREARLYGENIYDTEPLIRDGGRGLKK